MHQPIYEYSVMDVHNRRLVKMLDNCVNEATRCYSYSLAASMLAAYAERILKMNDEIGEMLT